MTGTARFHSAATDRGVTSTTLSVNYALSITNSSVKWSDQVAQQLVHCEFWLCINDYEHQSCDQIKTVLRAINMVQESASAVSTFATPINMPGYTFWHAERAMHATSNSLIIIIIFISFLWPVIFILGIHRSRFHRTASGCRHVRVLAESWRSTTSEHDHRLQSHVLPNKGLI